MFDGTHHQESVKISLPHILILSAKLIDDPAQAFFPQCLGLSWLSLPFLPLSSSDLPWAHRSCAHSYLEVGFTLILWRDLTSLSFQFHQDARLVILPAGVKPALYLQPWFVPLNLLVLPCSLSFFAPVGFSAFRLFKLARSSKILEAFAAPEPGIQPAGSLCFYPSSLPS